MVHKVHKKKIVLFCKDETFDRYSCFILSFVRRRWNLELADTIKVPLVSGKCNYRGYNFYNKNFSFHSVSLKNCIISTVYMLKNCHSFYILYYSSKTPYIQIYDLFFPSKIAAVHSELQVGQPGISHSINVNSSKFQFSTTSIVLSLSGDISNKFRLIWIYLGS